MTNTFDTNRLLRESAPVAAILAFWGLLSLLAPSVVGEGLYYAGVVMALLYVVVRAADVSRTIPPAGQPDTAAGLLYENVRVAVPAAVWFVLAILLEFVAQAVAALHHWSSALRPLSDFLASVLGTAAFALTGAGVAVVLLYALPVGLVRVRRSIDVDADRHRGEGW